ncbi:MAG: UvrD-helicase domain-containing protein, partial [Woeseiaceae bacterium]
TRDQWLPFIGAGLIDPEDSITLRGRFEHNLEQTVTEHLHKTRGAIDRDTARVLVALQNYAARQLGESGAKDHPVRALYGLDSLPGASADSVAAWNAVAELLLTKQGAWRKKVDKRQGFPPKDTGEKQAMHDLLEALAESVELAGLLHGVRTLPPVRYSDEQWEVLLALFRLLPVAVTELQRLFSVQGVADHIDIAMSAGAALGTAEVPGDIALMLDYQVKHILIDEMQDTSSAQYRMLEALTGGWESDDGRTLFCVGDPMQSIYRFRNAEVGQFLLARRHGIGGKQLESLLLRRNFRSGQYLVDWFNTVFPTILADEDDPASGAVSYSEALSVEALADVGDCTIHPLFGSSAAQEAVAGRHVIDNTLRRFEDDEMAVLVRSRTQLPGLLAELRGAGIDYRAVEIDRLTDLPEIIEVLALTRAAVHEGDRLAWLALLRAPWIGLSWADLHALVKNDLGSTVWELLQERIDRLSGEGRQSMERAMTTLEKLVAPRRSQALRSLVEECWLTLGGPGILEDEYAVDNVYRYLDVLGRHERGGTLDDVAALESMLDLERVSSDAKARLQIMTMHRAKGLEFEHVLLYGLGRIPAQRRQRVLSWYDVPGEHGEERKIISPVAPRAELDRDPVHRYIELAESRKDLHEQARLLYVACTRARKTLHLMGHTSVASDGASIRPPASRSLLRLLWAAVESQYEAAFETFEVPPNDSESDSWMDPVLRRFEAGWTVPAVTGLSAPETVMADLSDEVEFYWVGTEARIAGTVVHRWLHLLTEGKSHDVAENPSMHEAVTRRWLAETGVSGAMLEDISARVGMALSGVLADERGRWLLDGEGHAEFALSGFFDGRLQSVVLDRVRVDEDGTHWIVDYKTSTHEGGNLEGFLVAEADRYRPQLDKYAALYEAFSGVSARRALYFPLLQTFLEI